MPIRELTQEDITEAWRLQTVQIAKDNLARQAQDVFNRAKNAAEDVFTADESRAKATYEKAVARAAEKRDKVVAEAKGILEVAYGEATKAADNLETHQKKVQEETGMRAQLPGVQSGGRTRI